LQAAPDGRKLDHGYAGSRGIHDRSPHKGGHAVFRRPPSVAAALGGAVAIVLLASCADMQNVVDDALGGSGGQGARTVAYDCDDDRAFTARYSADRDEVRVRTDDETYDLELADRDDGRRVYTESGDDDDDEARLTIREGGGRARLDIPDEDAFEDCDGEI